jgi:hypothetical protein
MEQYTLDLTINLYALNPNGTHKWTYTTGSYVLGAPAIVSDGIHYTSEATMEIYMPCYDLNASANPLGGLFNSTQSITLTSNTPGTTGTIYYTAD